jgi:hypothetical protein
MTFASRPSGEYAKSRRCPHSLSTAEAAALPTAGAKPEAAALATMRAKAAALPTAGAKPELATATMRTEEGHDG